jgi:predicted outer membrane protein
MMLSLQSEKGWRLLRTGMVLAAALALPGGAPAGERPTVESLLASAMKDPANVLVIVEVAGTKRSCAVFPVAGISKVEGRRVTVEAGTFAITDSPPPDSKVPAKKLSKALLKKWKSRETENVVIVGSYGVTFAIGELKESRQFEVAEALEVARP